MSTFNGTAACFGVRAAAEWTREQWDLFIPIAQARAYGQHELDELDLEALRRRPLG